MAERDALQATAVGASRAVLAVGVACAALALHTRLPSAGAHLSAGAALGLLAFLATRRRQHPHVAAEILHWAAQLTLVLAAALTCDAPPLAALPALSIWAALLLWRRLDVDALAYLAGPIAIGQALLLGELLALPHEASPLPTAPSFLTAALMHAALALIVPLGVGAAVLVQARGTRRAQRWLPAAAGGAAGGESRGRQRRRLRAAAGLGLAALVAMLGLRTGADAVVSALVDDTPIVGEGFDRLDADPFSEARRRRTTRRFPESVDYGGTLGDLGQDVIVEVSAARRLGEPGRLAPVLLLGALRLDRFTDDGVVLDAVPVAVRDGDDGEQDGWIEFAPGALWGVELGITSVALTVGESDRAPLFHTGRLVSIGLPEARWHPRGVVTAAAPTDGVLEYTVRVGAPADRNAALDGGRAGRPGGFALELPAPSPELERLRALSDQVLGGAPDAGDAVARVLAHFADGYRYSFLGSDRTGLEGLVDFVDRREGFCSAYAATAALILRLGDVPARVVTGYRLSEYDQERARFVGRARDAHAWFEVHFEGLGWVPFDATPPEAIAAAREGEQGDESGPLAARLAWLAAAGGGLVAALLWSRRRRRRRRADGEIAREAPPLPGWFRALLAALERGGFGRRPSRTPREFAADLERAEHPEAGAVRDAVEIFYAERYARRPPSERERAGVEALTDRLRRRPRR